jgi:WD40 repeat protein
MLQTAKWLPPDQWALREYPTPTPDPTRSTAPALQLVGSLPAPHWREGLSLFAVTDQGEIARATTTRLTFYDPSTLQETRTGLVTLTADLTLAALNGNGTLLARAMGNTVEILDLTGLNEQGDPPVLGALQAARQMVVRLSFSPDGKSLAVVSQPARDDIGPALLEVYDTERLRRFGSWDMVYPPDLAFSPDSHWLMSWIRAGAAPLTYYALDPAAGSASRLTIDQQVVWDSASFSADSQTLAAATNGQIAFWTVPEGQPAGSWTINPSSVVSDLAYNAGDHYLAFAQPDGIELRRTADGSLAGFADPFAYWLAFAARGNDLFLTGMDGAGAVKVWWIDK